MRLRWPKHRERQIRVDTLNPEKAHLIKYVFELVLRQGRALHILDGIQLPRHPLTVLFPDRLHLLLAQLISYARVVSQIGLCTNDQTRNPGAVVVDFGKPLLSDVLE